MDTHYLNPKLDRTQVRKTLERESCILIRDILQTEVAETLYRSVRDQSDWEHTYMLGNVIQQEKLSQLRNKPPAELQQRQKSLLEQARRGYQFSYNRYSILDAVLKQFDAGNFMHVFLHYLNSEAFVGFAHDITQDREIAKLEAQACWYAPGQFLKMHQDNNPPNEDRRYAYVFGLTKGWQSDWGGLLQFVDQGKVTRTITPGFNTLTIFKVPQDHQVSYVAPYALQPRFTVTGWMRAK